MIQRRRRTELGKNRRRREPRFLLAHLAALGALVAVCGGSAAGCTGAPATDTSASRIETIVAGTFAAAATAASPTPGPPTPTHTPTPLPPTPTATAGPPVRVNFLADATTARVIGRIQAAQVRSYVFRAEQGRPLLVHVGALEPSPSFSIRTQGGTTLFRGSPGQITWHGTLPLTEDYYLDLYGGSGARDFALTLQLAEKIVFREGTTYAAVRGETVGGTVMAYSVLGVKGKEMEVGLSGAGDEAALSIYGYVDGKSYLSAANGKSSYTLEVATTQDYIVEVVPTDGQVVGFVLGVQMP